MTTDYCVLHSGSCSSELQLNDTEIKYKKCINKPLDNNFNTTLSYITKCILQD